MTTRRGFIGAMIAAAMSPKEFTAVEPPVLPPKAARIGTATEALIGKPGRLLEWRFKIRCIDGSWIWAPPMTEVERDQAGARIIWRVEKVITDSQFSSNGFALISPEGICVTCRDYAPSWCSNGDILKLEYKLDFHGFEDRGSVFT